jgi:heptosyltransferase II
MRFNLLKSLLLSPLQPAPPLESNTLNRVLVIRHKFIGDTILLSPFLMALKALLPPEATLDVLVSKGSGELLEGHPAVHRLIYTHTPQLAQHLKSTRYDATFVLKRSWSSLLMALEAEIPLRIGFATEGRSPWLTHPIPYPNPNGHEADAFLSCLAPLLPEGTSIPSITMLPWYHWENGSPLPPPLGNTLALYQEEGRIPVLIHAVASNPAKAWPLAHWQQLLHHLTAELPKLPKPIALFVTGALLDASVYEALREHLPPSLPLHNLCGKLSLPQSGLLMQHIRLAIGVDSGPMHLAAAGGASTLSLFGPMDSTRWKPLPLETIPHQQGIILKRHLPCQPCHLKVPCPFNIACLQQLEPQQVWDALKPLLQRM